jgi:archaellum component FlaC
LRIKRKKYFKEKARYERIIYILELANKAAGETIRSQEEKINRLENEVKFFKTEYEKRKNNI